MQWGGGGRVLQQGVDGFCLRLCVCVGRLHERGVRMFVKGLQEVLHSTGGEAGCLCGDQTRARRETREVQQSAVAGSFESNLLPLFLLVVTS